jgi:Transcription initiation factor IID, 18kD subunit
MLLAFGDDPSPLSETVRVLDDIITEFVLSLLYSYPLKTHAEVKKTAS